MIFVPPMANAQVHYNMNKTCQNSIEEKKSMNSVGICNTIVVNIYTVVPL